MPSLLRTVSICPYFKHTIYTPSYLHFIPHSQNVQSLYIQLSYLYTFAFCCLILVWLNSLLIITQNLVPVFMLSSSYLFLPWDLAHCIIKVIYLSRALFSTAYLIPSFYFQDLEYSSTKYKCLMMPLFMYTTKVNQHHKENYYWVNLKCFSNSKLK